MSSSTAVKPDLGNAPVGKLLFKLAVPCITAQIINLLYNVVDRIYIGHIPSAGSAALTGVGVTMPIITAVAAFAALICYGAAPRAATALGQQDKNAAEKIMGGSFSLLCIVAVILTIVVEIFKKPLLLSFGASEATLPYALQYIGIYALGTLFVQISLGMNTFINTQGYANWGMATVIIGAVLNIILDPLFIFVFGMGVQGAALATIISQGVSALFVLWFLRSGRSYLNLTLQSMHIDWKLILPCLALGLSPFIMQITESLLTICFNSSLLRYGGDIAVGSMTILASVMQFAMLPLQGLTQGAQPILSYNLGAAKEERILKTFRLLLISCIIYATALWALCELAPGLVASMFTADGELIKYCEWSLRIYMFGCAIFGVQIACQQTFVALGNAKTSLFLAVFRKIILLIPLIFILPTFIPDKVFAVFLAEPISDIVAALTTATLFFRYKRNKLPELLEKNKEALEAKAA